MRMASEKVAQLQLCTYVTSRVALNTCIRYSVRHDSDNVCATNVTCCGVRRRRREAEKQLVCSKHGGSSAVAATEDLQKWKSSLFA